ncbi:hypothetical protein QQP08_026996 [Theobroma cacao]|nr:hypothetical protein QQP08_026996 [Theobroma cacao]
MEIEKAGKWTTGCGSCVLKVGIRYQKTDFAIIGNLVGLQVLTTDHGIQKV